MNGRSHRGTSPHAVTVQSVKACGLYTCTKHANCMHDTAVRNAVALRNTRQATPDLIQLSEIPSRVAMPLAQRSDTALSA